MNICAECEFFLDTNPPGWDSLWDMLCTERFLPFEQHPVTGKMKYAGYNDMGGKYWQDVKYDACIKRNMDGRCSDFNPLTGEKK